MGKIISDTELAELLGPVATGIKAHAERRHPFKEYTYEELTNAPKKVYLCGDDDLVYPSLAVGADGAIMALPNLAPRLAVTLFKASKAGDAAKAQELHQVITKLVHVRRIPNHPGPLREAMAMVQRSVGLSRRPLMPMTDAEYSAVAAVTAHTAPAANIFINLVCFIVCPLLWLNGCLPS